MQIPIVALDFETYYDAAYSLSKITTEEYIRSPQFEAIGCAIWLPDAPAPVWYDTPAKIKQALQAIDWSTHAMLAHNVLFDGTIAAWHFGVQPKLYLDTMSMAQPRFGFTSGVSLASLAKVLGLGEKGDDVIHALGKRRANFTAQELAAYGRYCINDTVLCRRIFEQLLPLTPPKELALIDEAIRCYTDPRLVLDRDMVQEHYDQVVAAKQANYIWAGNLLGIEPEAVKDAIMSNDKLASLFMDIGVDPPTKLSPTTGKVAYAFAKTDDDFLELKEYPDERVQLLVECRLGGKSTLSETRALRLLGVADRGSLPVYLKYYAAHPGRYGGGDALNLQNVPRGSPLRSAIMAPPGHVCVVGDLSQIEARILVAIAGQHDALQQFKDFDAGTGDDVYCIVASSFLGRKVTKADKQDRMLGKVIRLALGYGMGVDKLIVTAKRAPYNLPLPRTTAEAAHKWYRGVSPAVVLLWKNAETALHKLIAGEEYTFGHNGCIVVKADGIHLPSGRVLRYPGLDFEPNVRQFTYLNRKKRVKIYGAKVVENICQSLAGSVGNDAWLRVRKYMKVVLQVHDELVAVALEEHAEEACARLSAALSAPVPWLPSLPVACEVGYHQRYGQVEKKKWV